LSNAIKFTPAGGAVRFCLRKKDNTAVAEIVDTGVGIPREKITRIFDTFYQDDSTMKRKYSGLGLGLAISREIIMLHGGRIKIVSKPGKGAMVAVTFPLMVK